MIVSNETMVALANKLIPAYSNKITHIKSNYNTQDIIDEVMYHDTKNKIGTAKFAKVLLKKDSIHTTLNNVFTFVKKNIKYKVDGDKYQLGKSPQAIWSLRICDCKGYGTFTSSILKNLNIPHFYKFAGYSATQKNVTHVYIIVPLKTGGYATIDACMPKYNEEKKTSFTILKKTTNG